MLSCDSWINVTVFVPLELAGFLTRHPGAPRWSCHGTFTLHIYLRLLGKTRILEMSQFNMFKGEMGLRGLGQPAQVRASSRGI